MFRRLMDVRPDRYMYGDNRLEEGFLFKASFQKNVATEEPETSREATPSEIIMDRDGDLRLEVGADHRDEPVTFLVCSKALARRSTIFKMMLFGPFAESNKSAPGGWVVQLPDDDPRAFAVLMHILHSNFESVPSFFKEAHRSLESPGYSSNSTLYKIARMTDKYDMVDVVRPWISQWLMEASTHHPNLPEPRFHGQLIWIAWVFGSEQLLKAELDAVTASAWIRDADEDDNSSDTDGLNVYPPVKQPKSQDGPQDLCFVDCQDHCFSLYTDGAKHTILDLLDVADDIKKTRLEALQSLLDPVVSFLKHPVKCIELTNGMHVRVYGAVLRCQVVYRSQSYGEQAFLLQFPPAVTPKTLGDFLPRRMIPEAADYHGSVVELYALLKSLEDYFRDNVFSWNRTSWPEMYDLMKKLDQVFKNRPQIELPKSVKERLECQRQKCGLKAW